MLALYRGFLDETFLVFPATEYIEKFRKYLKKQNKGIVFPVQTERNYSLSFLDVKIRRENNSFAAWVYRESAFNGVFSQILQVSSLNILL